MEVCILGGVLLLTAMKRFSHEGGVIFAA